MELAVRRCFAQDLIVFVAAHVVLAEASEALETQRPPRADFSGVLPLSLALCSFAAAVAVLAERKRRRRRPQKPPFRWVATADYAAEFEVSGEHGEIALKKGDFKTVGWVIPLVGSISMVPGNVYHWTLHFEQKSELRPHMQFGIQGQNFEPPWRLITTSRCSRAREDMVWIDRPTGDCLLQIGDTVSLELDLRGQSGNMGILSMAIGEGEKEIVFEDIPLSGALVPVLLMGGDGSRVRLLS
eukprot:gnl/MRDRNA2_/MRDRNA2_162401_c0_seq1.p1 gnl/MRDRNA2_/MRDRNA2_162401_c0~~gnl/MRDRNA2_/MRDRNA2_162401_c0_seq1.p1  ORF type:complete len:242 (+),score=40.33 gnl/MRDRNA2_/MRDRNA2_162401_c0_seq1:68-793(+)